jgi:hypothetical protein
VRQASSLPCAVTLTGNHTAEVLQGEAMGERRHSAASDVFALGMLVYEVQSDLHTVSRRLFSLCDDE